MSIAFATLAIVTGVLTGLIWLFLSVLGGMSSTGGTRAAQWPVMLGIIVTAVFTVLAFAV